MRSTIKIVPLLILAFPLCCFAQQQVETKVVGHESLDEGLSAYVEELVPLVFALGDGDIEQAREFLDKNMYYPDSSNGSALIGSKDAVITSQITPFQKWKLDFESVDFMQYKRLSSQGYTVMLVANGNSGPVMFAFTVFHHRGKWQLNEFSFQLAAVGYRATLPNISLAEPISFQRKTELVADDKELEIR